MWIRSQSKTMLIDVDSFVINDVGAIVGNIDDNTDSYWVLGKYKSVERALQVLDEIQEHMNYLRYTDTVSITSLSNTETVYQMPND